MKSLLPKKKKVDPLDYVAPERETVTAKAKLQSRVAKKDFKIVQNEFVREIKKGDDLADLPECYLENLKTEGVI